MEGERSESDRSVAQAPTWRGFPPHCRTFRHSACPADLGLTVSGITAHAPMSAGPGGTIRPGWFTNLYTFDMLDNRIQDDIDATGSNPASLLTSYSFDPNQNIIQITKPNGNLIQYDYDERNFRIAQRIGYAPNATPPRTRLGYRKLFWHQRKSAGYHRPGPAGNSRQQPQRHHRRCLRIQQFPYPDRRLAHGQHF